MNTEYKAQSEHTDADERALTPAFKRTVAQREQRWQDRALAAESHADKLAEALRDISKQAQIFFDDSKRESYKAIAYKAAQALAAYEIEVHP